ncbi:unnamed protein product [Linum tenue]|uniref:ATPase inhibitor n=1 Tax=Linum tenue TaxID=586396 RepID=A0AAV0JPK1_9ROSI|nr:unnamed protein product [Linum tenue]
MYNNRNFDVTDRWCSKMEQHMGKARTNYDYRHHCSSRRHVSTTAAVVWIAANMETCDRGYQSWIILIPRFLPLPTRIATKEGNHNPKNRVSKDEDPSFVFLPSRQLKRKGQRSSTRSIRMATGSPLARLGVTRSLRIGLARSMDSTRAAARYFSNGDVGKGGRVLSEEERAKETVYVQKMEREKLEKQKRKAEKEKAEKEKQNTEKVCDF